MHLLSNTVHSRERRIQCRMHKFGIISGLEAAAASARQPLDPSLELLLKIFEKNF